MTPWHGITCVCAWATVPVFYLRASPSKKCKPYLAGLKFILARTSGSKKSLTSNKSTLELACLTRFQTRLPCLFIVIGLTMSLRCGFVWSLDLYSTPIVLGYSIGARLSLCLYDTSCTWLLIIYPSYCGFTC